MWGLPTLPRRKFTASFSEWIPPSFIIVCTIDCSLLWRTRWPYPGSDTEARFAPYLSTRVPFFPKNLLTTGAITGHGCPRNVSVMTMKIGSSMTPKWSGGEWSHVPLMSVHAS